jgi:hypothetical protein
MKILKITNQNIGAEKIVVEVEGYPHAQPVFDAKITPEELEVALKAWKINQDEVDLLNSNASKEVKPVVEVDSKLTALIGKEIKL